MLVTSSLNMTSLMNQDCISSGKHMYLCANGQCVSGGPGRCPRSNKCDRYALKRSYCPVTGWCEASDWQCLRPCGYRQLRFHYKYKCSGFPGLCRAVSSSCPPVCDLEKPYKCHDDILPGVCAKGKNWCEYCFGYRCQIDGECIMSSKKCNGFSDCSDGADEVSCDISNNSFSDHPRLSEWQVAGLIAGVFLIILFCFYWCLKATRSAGEGAPAGAASTSQNQQNRSGGPRVAGTTPAAVIRPPAVRVRDVYTQRPSNTARSNPLSESGFYVPVASVPSDISPRGLTVVSNATRGHGAAASSLSESGFYVPAASVPSGASLRCHTVVSNAPRGYGAAASSPRSYPDAANDDTSGENPTIGPPPSYEDAMRNDNQNHAKDPMLPTYEEVTDGTPADKQTFL